MVSLSNWIEAIILLSKEENVLYHDPFITVVFTGNDPFLRKNIAQNRKRFITQPKHMIFW